MMMMMMVMMGGDSDEETTKVPESVKRSGKEGHAAR